MSSHCHKDLVCRRGGMGNQRVFVCVCMCVFVRSGKGCHVADAILLLIRFIWRLRQTKCTEAWVIIPCIVAIYAVTWIKPKWFGSVCAIKPLVINVWLTWTGTVWKMHCGKREDHSYLWWYFEAVINCRFPSGLKLHSAILTVLAL